MTERPPLSGYARATGAAALAVFHLAFGAPDLAGICVGLVAILHWRPPRAPWPRARRLVLILSAFVCSPCGLCSSAPGLPGLPEFSKTGLAGIFLSLALILIAYSNRLLEQALVHALSIALVVLVLLDPRGPISYLGPLLFVLVETPALAALHLRFRQSRLRRHLEAECRALRVPVPPAPPAPALSPWHAMGVVLGFLILAVAFATFLAIPRWRLVRDPASSPPSGEPAAGSEAGPTFGPDDTPWRHSLSGFTAGMELERRASIASSERPVFRARLLRDGYAFRAAQDVLYWRGRTLARFDGRRWSEVGRFAEAKESGGAIALPESPAGPNDVDVVQSIQVAPTWEKTLFALVQPVALEWLPSVSFSPESGALLLPRPPRTAFVYSVRSRLHLPGPATLSRSRLDRGVDAVYRSLPRIDPDLEQLARRWTAEQHTDYDVVRAVAAGLAETCEYSTSFELPRGQDPVRGFLLVAHTGHCELFASAMVVLLRTLELPARVATGFLGGEWDEFSQSYLVREKDAHAWVEVPFEGHGWVRFDPTPEGATLPASRLSVEDGEEAAPVEATTPDSSDAAPPTVESPEEEPAASWFEDLIRYDRAAQERLVERLGGGGGALVALVASILAALAWAVASKLLRPGPGGVPAPSAADAAEVDGLSLTYRFYDRALRRLARLGLGRLPAATPAEFAADVERRTDAAIAGAFGVLTRAFERLRYGRIPLDPDGIARVREADARLGRLVSARRGSRPGGSIRPGEP